MNLVIVGKSGSGKTEIVRQLTENFRYDKVVTATTRPMRSGEVDGEDYYFMTVEEFLEKENNGGFLESNTFRGWHYGVPSDSFKDDDRIIILTPSGLKKIKGQGITSASFFIKTDDTIRYLRQINRGDDIKEVARRSDADREDFEGIEDEVDFIVDNNTDNPMDCVIKILELISTVNSEG